MSKEQKKPVKKVDFFSPGIPAGIQYVEDETITHFTLHCYRIDAWAVCRPCLTFVNALANSLWGVFTLQGLKELLRALGLWYCETWGIGENEKLIPLHKGAFCRCCWNRRDVILFRVLRKITASRENHAKLLGDEVMKTASHRNCSLQATGIWRASTTGQEMGVSFYITKPLCWFQPRSLTSLFSAVQYNRVSNMRIHSTF